MIRPAIAVKPSPWLSRLLLALVRGYRLVLRPAIGNRCRFEPTCSAYAMDALTLHGAAVGSYLAAARVLRCNPLCPCGYDPVPEQRPALFKFLATRCAASPKSRPEVSP